MCLKPDHENLYTTATGCRLHRSLHLPLWENTRCSYSGVPFSFPPSRYGMGSLAGILGAGKETLRYWRDDCEIKEIIAWAKETNIPSVRTTASWVCGDWRRV